MGASEAKAWYDPANSAEAAAGNFISSLDAKNSIDQMYADLLSKSGGTMTGPLSVLTPAPGGAGANHAATRAYVDSAVAGVGGGGGAGSDAVYSVAASNTPTVLRDGADYICPSSGAQVTIQQALDALPSDGGEVVLLPGTYNITGTIYVGGNPSPAPGVYHDQISLRFQPGAVVKWLAVTGRTPLIQVVSSNCFLYHPRCEGSGSKGNGIGIQIGGNSSAINGGDQPGAVNIHNCRMTNLDTGIEYGIQPDGSQSSGDNVIWGGRITNSKIGIRSAGFVNYVYAPFISGCSTGIQQTADRVSGKIVVYSATINQWSTAAVELLKGRGSTFHNLWMEHTGAISPAATECIRINPSGTDRVTNPEFRGLTHVHPLDATAGTAELYGVHISGNVVGLYVEHFEFTDELPQTSLIRQTNHTGGSNVIEKISIGDLIPAGWDSSKLITTATSTGTVLIREMPAAAGQPAGTTVAGPNPIGGGSGGGGTANPTANFLMEYVSGTHGSSATYKMTRQDGTTVSATDSTTGSGVSGMQVLLDTALSEKPNGCHIHFAAGRFHALDAPLGTEAWAGEVDHLGFGGSDQQYWGLRLTGEGIDSTIISNRSNFGPGGNDTEAMSFTNAQGVTIQDLTVESCGNYKPTTDAIDFDQGSDQLVQRVLIRRSRARGIVVDGGDPGRHARHTTIRGVTVQGRPPRPGLGPVAGGTLTASTQYDYVVTWEDQDLGGTNIPAETKPSSVSTIFTDATLRSVRIYVPRGAYTTISRKVYRRSTTDGGWVKIADVAGRDAAVLDDTGLTSLGAAVFTQHSVVPESGIEFLGCSDSVVTDCYIDGVGDGESGFGALGNGINMVRKTKTPQITSDRNIITGNHVLGVAGHGLRVAGGNNNIFSDNIVRNVGFPATKRNGLRAEGVTGLTTDNNRFVSNMISDDRGATHPDGSGGMAAAYSVATPGGATSPNGTQFIQNMATGWIGASPMSDAGTNTYDRNIISSPVIVLASAAAVPSGTPAGTVILRTP